MLRLNAWKLVWRIRKVLNNDDTVYVEDGKIFVVDDKSDGVLTCEIIPRRLRIFDKISLKLYGVDVWIPLIPRILLRRWVRSFLIDSALEEV